MAIVTRMDKDIVRCVDEMQCGECLEDFVHEGIPEFCPGCGAEFTESEDLTDEKSG